MMIQALDLLPASAPHSARVEADQALNLKQSSPDHSERILHVGGYYLSFSGSEDSGDGSSSLSQTTGNLTTRVESDIEGSENGDGINSLIPINVDTPSRKRSLVNGVESRPRQRRRVNVTSNALAEQQLACPFAKYDPLKHRRCFKYKIQEISRLKQHLLRVHQQPIHCARCSHTFPNEDERDQHLRRAPGCAVQPSQSWEGISEAQKRQLAQRVSSKTSKEENWYLMYNILFPSSNRPASPYVDNDRLSEELLALREFAIREAPSRISVLARSQLSPDLPSSRSQVENFAQAAVRNVFDMVIEHWLRKGTSPSGCSPITVASTDADPSTIGACDVDASLSKEQQIAAELVAPNCRPQGLEASLTPVLGPSWPYSQSPMEEIPGPTTTGNGLDLLSSVAATMDGMLFDEVHWQDILR